MNLWPLIWMPIAFIAGAAVALLILWLMIGYLGLGALAVLPAKPGSRGRVSAVQSALLAELRRRVTALSVPQSASDGRDQNSGRRR